MQLLDDEAGPPASMADDSAPTEVAPSHTESGSLVPRALHQRSTQRAVRRGIRVKRLRTTPVHNVCRNPRKPPTNPQAYKRVSLTLRFSLNTSLFNPTISNNDVENFRFSA